jgi:hypothetical protein
MGAAIRPVGAPSLKPVVIRTIPRRTKFKTISTAQVMFFLSLHKQQFAL